VNTATSPLDLLEQYLAPEDLASLDAQAKGSLPARVVKRLSEITSPQQENDPNELIKSRFLCRGGILLFSGPTGIGKSAFGMQLAIHLAAGAPLFGIAPGDCFVEKGMKVLIVQAENDEGDLAEMRDGVLVGDDTLTKEQLERAGANVRLCSICDRVSDKFALELDLVIRTHGPFDFVMIDPAFAYLGGDGSSQKDVSHFMRELMIPICHTHNIGMAVIHHTNKPLRGKEKDNWQSGDFAYLGSGSAEWINCARAALTIRSLGSDRIFELRAPKRGRRLRWPDPNGGYTTMQHIAHHEEPGTICWREARPEEVEELMSKPSRGRPKKCTLADVLREVGEHEGESQSFYTHNLHVTLGCARNTAQNAITEAVRGGFLKETKEGRKKTYSLTDKGRALLEPSVSRSSH